MLFAARCLPLLWKAGAELAWLLNRGYSSKPALELVGDHHQLHRRQREALQRTICTATRAQIRRSRKVSLQGRKVAVDGFNVLIGIEAALSGGLMLRGLDGFIRNLADMRGTYRMVEETSEAAMLAHKALTSAAQAVWFLDRPVSNCFRLATLLHRVGCHVRVIDRVDHHLCSLTAEENHWIIATADSRILDRVPEVVDLPALVLPELENVWLLDFTAFEDDR